MILSVDMHSSFVGGDPVFGISLASGGGVGGAASLAEYRRLMNASRLRSLRLTEYAGGGMSDML
jgi:hypothetical protein